MSAEPLTREEIVVIRQALAEFGAKSCCGSRNALARALVAKFPLPERAHSRPVVLDEMQTRE